VPRLLIVDDHAGMTMSIRVVAESLGFECRVVNQPDEAVPAFLAFRPDVLLLDMMMPETDGIDVLGEILRTDVESRFILTSGYGEGFLRLGERMVKGRRGQPVRLLRKPFRREQLVEVLSGL
jgi:CheY-like chemotaxis protein